VRRIDLALLAGTGMGWVVLAQWMGFKGPTIAAVVVAWIGWMAVRARAVPDTWDALGVRREGFVPSLAAAAPIALVAAVGMLAVGIARGAFPVPIGFWVSLALYPLWGVVQQAITQGMVAGGLRDRVPRPLVVALTAAAFAAVHFPHPELMVATFALALGFTPIWLRHRNVLALGLLHGWLGALLYYLVLGRDPIGEITAGASRVELGVVPDPTHAGCVSPGDAGLHSQFGGLAPRIQSPSSASVRPWRGTVDSNVACRSRASAAQKLTVRSEAPVARVCPSGVQASAVTGSACGSRARSIPVATDQIRAV
jgi:hypothetical protein